MGAVSARAPKTRCANVSCSSRSRRRAGSPVPIFAASHATSTGGDDRTASAVDRLLLEQRHPEGLRGGRRDAAVGREPQLTEHARRVGIRTREGSVLLAPPRHVRREHGEQAPQRVGRVPSGSAREAERHALALRIQARQRVVQERQPSVAALDERREKRDRRPRALADDRLPDRLGLAAAWNAHDAGADGEARAERGKHVRVALARCGEARRRRRRGPRESPRRGRRGLGRSSVARRSARIASASPLVRHPLAVFQQPSPEAGASGSGTTASRDDAAGSASNAPTSSPHSPCRRRQAS